MSNTLKYPPIRLMVGLGNIGKNYEKTRHNAGFFLVSAYADQLQIPFKSELKFLAQLTQFTTNEEAVIIAKPETLMNLSGKAVQKISHFYKIPPQQILVIHDELDLPAGSARLKFSGGNGGHNGLKSISALLGTVDFWRLRIGIGHPGNKHVVSQFVLNAPTAEEREQIQISITKSLKILPLLLQGDFDTAMQLLHTEESS